MFIRTHKRNRLKSINRLRSRDLKHLMRDKMTRSNSWSIWLFSSSYRQPHRARRLKQLGQLRLQVRLRILLLSPTTRRQSSHQIISTSGTAIQRTTQTPLWLVLTTNRGEVAQNLVDTCPVKHFKPGSKPVMKRKFKVMEDLILHRSSTWQLVLETWSLIMLTYQQAIV